MIYVATVHWKTDKWIDLQLAHLGKYLNQDFRIFAYLNDIPPGHNTKFYYSSEDSIKNHATKLNLLADQIIEDSKNDDDIIIFLDGDAFPIADLTDYISHHINQYSLIAVKRTEEDNEQQPHPCFCITTIRFWKEIKGDWTEGYSWQNSLGQDVTDVGGNLLGILTKQNIPWLKLERTNKTNLHPILFAIYGNVVYHHGAGFRSPVFRINKYSANFFHLRIQEFVMSAVPSVIRHLIPDKIRYKLRTNRKVADSNQELSQRIYHYISTNPSFVEDCLVNGKTYKDKIFRKTPVCVIILGMHSSGTSCLAGSLMKNGLYLGEVNIESGFNQLGTIEYGPISLLNDEVLAYNGGTWRNPPHNINWNETLSKKRDEIIEHLSIHATDNIWGFKDPKTILTLPFWLEGLNEFKLVAAYRNPNHVVKSLMARDGQFKNSTEITRLWNHYNYRLLEHLNMWNGHLIRFDSDEREYHRNIKKLILELSISSVYGATYVPFYKNHIIRTSSISNELSIDSRDIYKSLNDLAARSI